MKITAETGIMDIVNRYPLAASVFQAYGMGCVGCMAARFETVGEGAAAHGIDIEELLIDLNDIV